MLLMNTILLLLFLFFLLFAGYSLSGKSLSSPSILLVFPIIFATLDGLILYTSWDFNLSFFTVCVIVICLGAFVLGCIVVSITFRTGQQRLLSISDLKVESTNKPNKNKLYILVFIINVLIILYIYQETRILVRNSGYPASTPIDVISGLDQLKKFTSDSDNLSGIPAFLSSQLIGEGILFSYLLAKSVFVYKRSYSRLCLTNFVLLIFGLLILGGRGTALCILVSFCLIYFMLNEREGNVPSFMKIPTKIIGFIILGVSTFVLLFILVLPLFGRDLGENSPLYYISVYLGAPLKNLDIAFSGNIDVPENTIPGQYTFYYLFQTLGKAGFAIPDLSVKNMLPFQSINGNMLGNVYTVFFAPVHDFGIIVSSILFFVAGVCMQLIHELAFRSSNSETASLFLIAYGYLAFHLAQGFFSPIFFYIFISLGFVKTMMLPLLFFIVGRTYIEKEKQIYSKDQTLLN